MTKRRNRGAPPQSRMTRSGPAPKPSGRQPIRKQATVARNAPCPCGSGAKYKKCHGKLKPAPSRVLAPYQTFASQYDPAQQQAVLDFVARWGFNPNLTQLQMFMENDVDGLTAMISGGLARIDDNEKFVFAVRKLYRLITPKNQSLVSDDVKEEWEAALAEYDECHRITDDSGEAGPGSPQGAVRPSGEAESAAATADA